MATTAISVPLSFREETNIIQKRIEERKMKADRIIKNAIIFTADKEKPLASALVVKDGKFIYVGDEDGLSTYDG